MSNELIEKAKAWIDDPKRDYDEGVSLYAKLGKNRNIMRALDRKGAEKGMDILLYNLGKAVSHQFVAKKTKKISKKAKGKSKDKPSDPNTTEKAGRVRIKKNPTIDYNLLPEDLKILFDENVKQEGEKKSVHAKMTALPEDSKHDAERKEYAERLDAIEASQAINWNLIDTWWNNKDKEPDPIPEPLSEAAQATKDAEIKTKRVVALKSQASRRTKKLKKLPKDAPDRKKVETELSAIVEELKTLGEDYSPRK